ncbi:UNVERIFIED_ORG: peptidase U35 [Clostridium botulinum]
MEKEIIQLNNTLEIRTGEDKKVHIQGYALTFDTISEDLGFKETIRSGALDECDMSDVVLNFNHDMDKPLARNKKQDGIGSLTLKVDEKGLFFDAIPTETTYSRDLISNMEAGIVGKCSFAFSLNWSDKEAQSWDWDDGNRGYDFRTINKIKSIHDVSIVVNPAYESTSATIYQRAKETQYINKNEELEELRKICELQEIENELED